MVKDIFAIPPFFQLLVRSGGYGFVVRLRGIASTRVLQNAMILRPALFYTRRAFALAASHTAKYSPLKYIPLFATRVNSCTYFHAIITTATAHRAREGRTLRNAEPSGTERSGSACYNYYSCYYTKVRNGTGIA